MPIRYYIDLPCQPREDLGAAELVEKIAIRERAAIIRQRFVNEFNLSDETKMRFREKRVNVESRPRMEERTVAELMEETAALDRLAGFCDNCPALLMENAYGCTNLVGLPLSLGAQQWLLAQLPEAGSRGLELFIDAVTTNNYGYSPRLAHWRKSGMLEGEVAPSIDKSGLLISADMVLEELFLVGDLMPAHALGILLHLRCLASSDGRSGDALLELLEKVDAEASAEDAPQIDFGLRPEAADDESTREVKQFLYALFRAFSLQVPLGIVM